MLQSLTRLFITLILISLLLTQINFDSLCQQASSSNVHLFALATLCICGQIFFLNLRWHQILNTGIYKIPFDRSALINLSSYFANIIFLTSIGGVIAKSALTVKEGTTLTYAILATIIDRFMSMATLIMFSAISLPVLYRILDKKTESFLAISLLSLIISSALFIYFIQKGTFNSYIKEGDKLSHLTTAIKTFTQDKSCMVKIIYNSIIAQSLFFISSFILSTNMHYDGTTLQFIALLPVLALISSLPISFGGWGVREGAFIYGLGIIGFSQESAFLLSVQVGIITLIAPFLVALPYAFKKENNLLFFLQSSRSSSKNNAHETNI